MLRDIYLAEFNREREVVGCPQRIEAPDGFFTHPALSPDGRRIAFWGIFENTLDLWIAECAGGRAERLTRQGGVCCHPAWTPDSRCLVYACNPSIPAGPYETVWGPQAAGFAPRHLRRSHLHDGRDEALPGTTAADHQRPAVGPDGERLLVVRTEEGVQKIVLGELSGETSRALELPVRKPFRPAWHPGGARLAFNTKGEGSHRLGVAELDGTGCRLISPEPEDGRTVHDHGAFWVDAGERILFHSDRSGRWGLWTISPDGTQMRPLEVRSVSNASHPTLDAAETFLAFDAAR
jgi:Tol biopolymer transport system component